jgi:WD40 repeat protein/energy-coupling factor transporter ATP-binding protein EcfA2
MIPDKTNPYVGLRPFDVDESILFFGRTEQTLELLQRLHQHHFVAVVGSSGCGKSSLLRAGLIPALKAGYLVDDSDQWVIIIMKPGKSPLYNLAESLLQQINPAPHAADVSSLLHTINEEGADAILKLIIPLRKEQNVNFFLLVDQFEELFRFAMDQKDVARKDEAIDFVNIMLELSQQKIIPFYAVITMRSDFIGDCAQFYGLPEAMNKSQYLVPRLNRIELKTVIEGPAKLFGGKLNHSLISRLLNESGKVKDELPLLQHSLMRMWDFEINRDKSGVFGQEDYESIGGIENALNNHADEALTGLNEQELNITKKIFQALTAIDEYGRKIRRPVLLSQLRELTGASEEQILHIINLFIKDRRSFLIIDKTGDTGDKVIDISHESLIRQWHTLGKWVDEEGEAASGYFQLAQSATMFKQHKRDFLDGTELNVALEWYDRFKPAAVWANRYEDGFNDTIDYLMESRKVHAKKEQQRLAGLKQEEERQKSDKATKQRKRFFTYGMAVLALLIVIVVLIIVRFNKLVNEVEKQKGNAQIYHLSSDAKGAVDDDPTLALRIAEEAMLMKNDSAGQNLALEIYSKNSFYKILIKHNSPISFASFSPAGDKIIFVSGRAARLIDLHGNTITEFTGHTGNITSAAFSPGGDAILTGSSDSTARLWDLNGNLLQEFNDNSGINAVAFSPKENTILTGSNNNLASLWNLKGVRLKEFTGPKEHVTAVAFSPDGNLILTGSAGRTARLYDLNGNIIMVFKGHLGPITSVAFSPDGKTIVTGSSDNTVRIWNTLNGETLHELLGHLAEVTDVIFSSNGNRILTGSRDHSARLWDLNGNELQHYKGHSDNVNSVNFSPDDNTIITASDDNTVRLWVQKAKLLKVFEGHSNTISSVAFSPGGQNLLTGSLDMTARLWDLNGNTLQIFKDNSKINSVVFSPDGKTILTGCDDNMARLWSLEAKTIMQFKGHTGKITSVAFSPDGNKILTGSADSTARLWDPEGNILVVLTGHSDIITSVCFSPDGNTLLTGSKDRSARLWNLDGKLLQEFNGHRASVNAVAFSPTGDQVLTGSDDKTARLWSLNGKTMIVFAGHYNGIRSVAFSPDGKAIITGSSDNSACYWDLNGNPIQIFNGHLSDVISVAFSPDGKTILTGSMDNYTRLWPVPMPLIDFLKSDKIEALTDEQKKQYGIEKKE